MVDSQNKGFFDMEIQKVKQMSKKMRKKILDVTYSCNMSVHIGGALSMVDILATLYSSVLKYDKKKPTWADRDRFILSKGHGALGYYSALLEAGIISEEIYSTFQTNESDLTAHPVMNIPLGIESSNGSLGHGLSLGIGIALAGKKKKKNYKTYVFLGNGECNEGSVWEAIMSASSLKLENLIAIVDDNGFQNEIEPSKTILDSSDFCDKWESFGWNVCSVDGHNISEIYNAIAECNVENKPKVVIAKTIKGKGVSFMENNNEWHHNRLTEVNYNKALQELGEI
jgi:transketolase